PRGAGCSGGWNAESGAPPPYALVGAADGLPKPSALVGIVAPDRYSATLRVAARSGEAGPCDPPSPCAGTVVPGAPLPTLALGSSGFAIGASPVDPPPATDGIANSVGTLGMPAAAGAAAARFVIDVIDVIDVIGVIDDAGTSAGAIPGDTGDETPALVHRLDG